MGGVGLVRLPRLRAKSRPLAGMGQSQVSPPPIPAAGIGLRDHVTERASGARDRAASRTRDHGGGVLGLSVRGRDGGLDLAPELGTAELEGFPPQPATAPGPGEPVGHLLSEEPASWACGRRRGPAPRWEADPWPGRRTGGRGRLTVLRAVEQSLCPRPASAQVVWRTAWLSFWDG